MFRTHAREVTVGVFCILAGFPLAGCGDHGTNASADLANPTSPPTDDAAPSCPGCTDAATEREDAVETRDASDPENTSTDTSRDEDAGLIDDSDATADTATGMDVLTPDTRADTSGSPDDIPDTTDTPDAMVGDDTRDSPDITPDTCGDECDPFSIILIPDTQYYTSKQAPGVQNTYMKQTRWIASHAESDRIAFVIHMGDLTDHNTTDEWDIASDAHAILDDANVPYSVMPGNHDYLVGDHDFDRGGSLFDEYFGPSRFLERPHYGGGRNGSNLSNYATFEAGRAKFLVLSVEYAPRQETLCWANDVIGNHPDHHVIIATHCYLTRDGAYAANCPDVDYSAIGGSGRDVWNQLASRHSNVFMVVSGHIGESAHVPRAGISGNIVHQMVVDYQFEAPCSALAPEDCSRACRTGPHTGNGWLRKLTFDPRNDKVRAETFSVEEGNPLVFPGGVPTLFCSPLFETSPGAKGGNWYSADPTAPDHAFEFDYDLQSLPEYRFDSAGSRSFIDRTINTVAAGAQERPVVAIHDDGVVVTWEDDSSTTDGTSRDIMARGNDKNGCGGFSDIVVNSQTAGQQSAPTIASDEAGNFVVVWEDDSDLNGVYQLHARGFTAQGLERIARWTVNSEPAGQQRAPDIAMTPAGDFVVTWADDPESDGRSRIMARGFDANGQQRFPDRVVSERVDANGMTPSVAVDMNGNILITWEDDSDGNGVSQIAARRLTATGEPLSATFIVNRVAAGHQQRPAAATSASGVSVIAWMDDPDMDGVSTLRARLFDVNGESALEDFEVSDSSGAKSSPVVAMSPSGEFVIGWEEKISGNYDIFARKFRADGLADGAPSRVNRVPSGPQKSPAIALHASGMTTVWADDLDENGGFQILGRAD
jgi:hypothetical protein